MWETSQGTRTLVGAEAHLLRELIHYLHDQFLVAIEIDEPHFAGVQIFDTLQPTQQLVMLHQVAMGLLDADTSPQMLTATAEATIYVLFRELVTLIEAEINFATPGIPADYFIRTLVCSAYRQGYHENTIDTENDQEAFCHLIPPADSSDIEHWSDFVESVADNILWDRDFEFEQLVADSAPQRSQLLKLQLGINDQYYSSIARDIHPKEVDQLSQQIRKLTPATECRT